MDVVKNKWLNLTEYYSTNPGTAVLLWNVIHSHYSEPHRYYHNLDHIHQMIQQYDLYKSELKDPDPVLFSVFYHDIIHNPYHPGNEEKSAEFAIEQVKNLDLPEEFPGIIERQILSTKQHMTNDHDTKFLIDFDLAVLGENQKQYEKYTKKIRMEYSGVPDQAYRSGRIEILQRFLRRNSVFLTEQFISKYESAARRNMNREIEALSGL